MEAFKERSESTMNFIEKCFEQVTDVDEKNKNGFSIRKLDYGKGEAMNLKKDWRKNMHSTMNLGGCVVSKNILEKRGRLKWCFREESVNNIDNGWRFLSEIDTDEFLADSKKHGHL